MKHAPNIAKYIFAAFLILGGINHFYKPELYSPFIPSIFPENMVNYGSGILEIILGLGLLIKRHQKNAAIGCVLLMLIFLPIHIWDALKDTPVIGSKIAANIRIIVQFIFIAWPYYIYKKSII
ncbi:hypothetical protein [Tenacibaculum sp. SG-28]|uniref:hypothetical protein n=1 Tax=Tenacibaculum sp. SG-28 TaxID=754426 RepID=UPI000CF53DFD|nr:hypothetical protein [Tenacibaculum sp. SG-28]PQJ22954.1 hypothetical protein BSU00_01360 [Tenacibaculum sp. SG-28]